MSEILDRWPVEIKLTLETPETMTLFGALLDAAADERNNEAVRFEADSLAKKVGRQIPEDLIAPELREEYAAWSS
jgi:hypothetical protein